MPLARGYATAARPVDERNGVRGRFRWDFGLGREVGLVLWAMVCDDAAYSAFMSVWALWMARLGAPVTVIGLLLGATGILRLLVLTRAASLTERFAPRTLAVVSRVLLGLGLVTAGFAQHWTQLAPMLLLSAFSVLASPVAKSHVSDHAGEKRVRAYTLVFSVAPAVSFGLSPLLAGLIIAKLGMAAVFFYSAAWCVASALVYWRLDATVPKAPATEDSRSSFREAFADPGVRLVLGLQAASVFAMSVGTSLLPPFLEEVQGLHPATIAALGSTPAIGSIVFGLFVARSPRFQGAPLAAAALCAVFVSASLAVCLSTNLVWLLAVAFLGRGGLLSAWGMFGAALAEVAPDRHRMRVFSLGDMGTNLAFWSAPILSGQLYAIAPQTPVLASIAVSLALVPLLLAGQRRAGSMRVAPAA